EEGVATEGASPASAAFPRPLWAGAGGGVSRRQARMALRSVGKDSLARCRAQHPSPFPPPTRGGGMFELGSSDAPQVQRGLAQLLLAGWRMTPRGGGGVDRENSKFNPIVFCVEEVRPGSRRRKGRQPQTAPLLRAFGFI